MKDIKGELVYGERAIGEIAWGERGLGVGVLKLISIIGVKIKSN